MRRIKQIIIKKKNVFLWKRHASGHVGYTALINQARFLFTSGLGGWTNCDHEQNQLKVIALSQPYHSFLYPFLHQFSTVLHNPSSGMLGALLYSTLILRYCSTQHRFLHNM